MNFLQFGILDELLHGPEFDENNVGLTMTHHMEEAELADKLGFDYFFMPEHQCTPGYAISSASIIIAILSKTTSRIRIGPMIYLVPLNIPGKLAADISYLDHLSNGRLEVGLGSGSVPAALETFGYAWEKKAEVTFEAMEIMLRAWTGENFSFKGKHYDYSNYQISLTPLQKPHPPLWYPTRAFDTIEWLVRNNVSTVQLAVARSPFVKQLFDHYRKTAEQLGIQRAGHLGVQRQAVIAETDREALEIARNDHTMSWKFFFAQYDKVWQTTNLDMKERAKEMFDIDALIEQNLVLYGSPHTVAKKILDMEEYFGMDTLLASFCFGTDTYKYSKKSMKLFSDEVIPIVREELAKKSIAQPLTPH